MVKDLERADTAPALLSEGGDASRIGKKLLVLTKSRFSRVSRLAVQVSIAFFFLLVLFNCVPSGTEAVLGPEYSRYWKWPYSSTSPAASFNISEAGPTRMVVFGTPDAWTPAKSEGTPGPSWSMALCVELGCTHHSSMVPPVDLPAQAVTSKGHYAVAVDALLTEFNDTTESGTNYNFLQTQYPASAVADLPAQVDAFLAQDKPSSTPRETIWVFTLGTWDVWTLAGLDRERAESVLASMADVVFQQIERLYTAALDASSPAYSDYYAYADDAAALLRDLTDDPSARAPEAFRLVVPDLLDISLAPGWNALRPSPPSPHTSIEHLTTASRLTKLWNAEISTRLAAWQQTPDPDPSPPPRRRAAGQPQPNGKPFFGFWDAAASSPSTADDPSSVLLAPYPRRLALHANLTAPTMDALVDGQLRAMRMPDAQGRGKAPKTDPAYFADVQTPCLAGYGTPCDKPNDHLWYAPFTLGERAVREAAKRAAQAVAETLYA